MAFLDNSGDIILDAVLTDTGRMRLAKGDGSFRITKFALGDDEIDYSLYDKNNASGSSYYDLELLRTPIFEAFTNNIASLNSRLISIAKTDHLFLPVIKTNNIVAKTAVSTLVQNGYVLSVDQQTDEFLSTSGLTSFGNAVGTDGIVVSYAANNSKNYIRVDQGIDNSSYPFTRTLDPDLVETQYLIEIDSRFANIISVSNNSAKLVPSYIDDDYIAAHYVTLNVDADYVLKNTNVVNNNNEVISGARGTILKFTLEPSDEVGLSDYLFNQLGQAVSGFSGSPTPNVRSILTSVRITGLTTGNFIDIPLLLLKKIS